MHTGQPEEAQKQTRIDLNSIISSKGLAIAAKYVRYIGGQHRNNNLSYWENSKAAAAEGGRGRVSGRTHVLSRVHQAIFGIEEGPPVSDCT